MANCYTNSVYLYDVYSAKTVRKRALVILLKQQRLILSKWHNFTHKFNRFPYKIWMRSPSAKMGLLITVKHLKISVSTVGPIATNTVKRSISTIVDHQISLLWAVAPCRYSLVAELEPIPNFWPNIQMIQQVLVQLSKQISLSYNGTL